MSDVVGSVEARPSSSWGACLAAFLALRAALDSAARFFFAHSPMVDDSKERQ